MIEIEKCCTRSLWRLIEYLQRDAKRKGIMHSGSVASFWNNLDVILEDREHIYIAKNSRGHMVGFFVVDRHLDRTGTLGLDIFEVLPRHRGKGIGRQMVDWLKREAKGFDFIRLKAANLSHGFWELMGFERDEDRFHYYGIERQPQI
jgi:GNAT superfamily N-acetyltransferase